MRKKKQLTACLLSFALLLGMIPTAEVKAAKKISLSSKKITVTRGKSKTLKVQNTKKKVKWKILSGKKYITLKKKGKVTVSIKGKKKGTAKVQATVGKKKLTCKVTVINTTITTPNPVVTVAPTSKPTATVTPSPSNPSKTPVPTVTPSSTNTPLPANPTNAPEGANSDDVKALQELIRIHREHGADISEDMSNAEEYQWNNNRLIGIYWRHKNVIGELDVTCFSALKYLECSYEDITIDGYMPSRLTSLNVSQNTALEVLRCYGTNLQTIDVSNNINLRELDCTGNYLSNLDVSKNTVLQELNCSYNDLSNLNLSNNNLLTFLNCDNNLLTQLNLSNNTNLGAINCRNNQLSSLDCSNIKPISGTCVFIACTNNQLTSLLLPVPAEKSYPPVILSLFCTNNRLTTLDFTGRDFLISSLEYDNTVTLIGYDK